MDFDDNNNYVKKWYLVFFERVKKKRLESYSCMNILCDPLYFPLVSCFFRARALL